MPSGHHWHLDLHHQRPTSLLSSRCRPPVLTLPLFGLVQSAATTIGPTTGDAIALAIAFARLVVVPLKQIGITYARMASASQRAASAPRRVVDLYASSSPDLLVALLGVLAYSMTGGPMGGSLLLTLLTLLTLLVTLRC